MELGLISENLFSVEEDNKKFVLKYIIDMNSKAFTHLHKLQIESFSLSLFNKIYNFHEFKTVLRDFLVNLKSFSGSNDELFEEERAVQINEARGIEEKKRMNIPGLLPVFNVNESKRVNISNYKFDQ